MQKPAIVDESAIDAEEKTIDKKLLAIERLIDEIDLQYDYRASVDLKDIERI